LLYTEVFCKGELLYSPSLSQFLKPVRHFVHLLSDYQRK